jgi:N-acetylglucosamine kinase-like BadF-type ATPase
MPSTPTLIGVDAGASHCTVAIAGEDLEARGRAEGQAAALRPGGAAIAAAAIAETARRAAAGAGLALPADRAVVGAAGAGREQEQEELAAAVVAAGVARTVRVLPDGETALAAAFGDGPGIIINAGTGSVAFARDSGGVLRRSGGHGWQLGDEGGGYWLGRRALDAAARAQDGRGEGSTMLARVLGSLGLQRFEDLVRWTATATPAQVATLAPHVLNAATEGEAVAQRVIGDAAQELVALVLALERYFPGTGPIGVATTGGLLGPASPLTIAFRDALAAQMPRARLGPTAVDAALGALHLARTLTPRTSASRPLA